MQGVHTAYYLVHLMSGSKDFEKEDRQAATNFAEAAKKAGVRRIIYLGGLGDDADPKLSPHLRSRHEVGKILRDSGVETIEFRASLVIGTGSLSFDLVKSLTDRLPVMLCPRWLTTPTQPIAVDDVLAYLLAAKDLPPGESRIFEIGSPDVTTYGDMIREYARQKGLRRWLISVPVLTPYLSSLWLALVTPASFEVGRHLIEGLKNPTVVRDKKALEVFPIRPMGMQEAIQKGHRQHDRGGRYQFIAVIDSCSTVAMDNRRLARPGEEFVAPWSSTGSAQRATTWPRRWSGWPGRLATASASTCRPSMTRRVGEVGRSEDHRAREALPVLRHGHGGPLLRTRGGEVPPVPGLRLRPDPAALHPRRVAAVHLPAGADRVPGDDLIGPPVHQGLGSWPARLPNVGQPGSLNARVLSSAGRTSRLPFDRAPGPHTEATPMSLCPSSRRSSCGGTSSTWRSRSSSGQRVRGDHHVAGERHPDAADRVGAPAA